MPTGGNEYDYQFYFAFIRENLYSPTSSSENVSSACVSVCSVSVSSASVSV